MHHLLNSIQSRRFYILYIFSISYVAELCGLTEDPLHFSQRIFRKKFNDILVIQTTQFNEKICFIYLKNILFDQISKTDFGTSIAYIYLFKN